MPSKSKWKHRCRCRLVRSSRPLLPDTLWIEIQTMDGETLMRSVKDYPDIESAREDAIALYDVEGYHTTDDCHHHPNEEFHFHPLLGLYPQKEGDNW